MKLSVAFQKALMVFMLLLYSTFMWGMVILFFSMWTELIKLDFIQSCMIALVLNAVKTNPLVAFTIQFNLSEPTLSRDNEDRAWIWTIILAPIFVIAAMVLIKILAG